MPTFSDLLAELVVTPQSTAPVNPAEPWLNISRNASYSFSSPEEKAAIKAKFLANTPNGQAMINQVEGPNRSSLENLKIIATESLRNALDAARLSDDVATGIIDNNTSGILAENAKRASEQYIPESLKSAYETMSTMKDKWNNAQGFSESLQAGLSIAGEATEKIFTNPEGIAQTFAQSAGNMLPSTTGQAIGGIAGSFLPVPGGKMLGAGLGALVGGLSTEAGARLIEEAQLELQRLGLPPTADNFTKIFSNETFKESAMAKAKLKAIGTAGVDTALGVGIGKMGISAAKTAEKQATLMARSGVKAAKYGSELLSEPFSEMTGQLAAGDKINAGELVGEFWGGVGGSAITAPLDVATYGAKEIQHVANTAPADSDSIMETRTAHDYEDKIDALTQAKDVSEYSNPASAMYNPVLAADALANIATQTNISDDDKAAIKEQAIGLYNQVSTSVTENQKQMATYSQAFKDKTISEEDISKAKVLNATLKAQYAQLDAIDKQHNLISSVPDTATIENTLNDPAKHTDEEITGVVTQILGSQNYVEHTNTILTPTVVDNILNNATVSDNVKELVKSTVAYSKTMAEVSSDIIQGGAGYKGLLAYQQNISKAISKNQPTAATEELAALAKFANDKQMRASTFRNYLIGLTVAGKPISQIDKDNMAILNSRKERLDKSAFYANPKNTNKLFKFTPYSIGKNKASIALVEQAELEAGLLAKSVNLMDKAISTIAKSKNAEATVNPTVETTKQTVSDTASAVASEVQESSNITLTATPEVKPFKPLAYVTKDNKIHIKSDLTEQEFWDYIDGKADSVTSEQKKVVLNQLKTKHGITREFLTKQLSDLGKIKTFLQKHEQSHINHKDKNTYFKNGKDYLTQDKIDIEIRATLEALGIGNVPPASTEGGTTEGAVKEAKSPVSSNTEQLNNTEVSLDAPEYLTNTGEYDNIQDSDYTNYIDYENSLTNTPFEISNTLSQDDSITLSTENTLADLIPTEQSKQEQAASKLTDRKGNIFTIINNIKEFFSIKKNKSLFQKTTNVVQLLNMHLRNNTLDSLTTVFNKNNPVTVPAQKAVDSMISFYQSFDAANRAIFKEFKLTQFVFRKKDPIQFFSKNGVLDEHIKQAIALHLWHWLATKGADTLFNDEKGVCKLLGLPEETVLPPSAEALAEVGVSSNILVDTIGHEVLKTLGFAVNKHALTSEQERLSMSVGLMAIATLEKMGILTRHNVPVGLINAIKQDISDLNEKGIITSHEVIPGHTAAYFRLTPALDTKTNIETIPQFILDIQHAHNQAKNTFAFITRGEPDKTNYSFVKPAFKENYKAPIKNSKQLASKVQTANLIKNDSRSWVANSSMFNIFMLMSPKHKQLLQYADPTQSHITKKRSAESVNRSHDKAISDSLALLEEAKNNGSYSTPFYILSELAKQTRMHQVSSVNPQGNKIQRWLFSMTDWATEFSPITNKKQDDNFHLAVGLSLGLEVAKIGSAEDVIKATKEEVTKPAVRNAITALKNIFSKETLDTINPKLTLSLQEKYNKEIDTILNGVNAYTGVLHTLKGLVEYARYELAIQNKTKLTSDIAFEIDGRTNGGTIGRYQLLSNQDKEINGLAHVAALQSAGIQFSDAEDDSYVYSSSAKAENIHHHDSYQTLGMKWTKFLTKIENSLIAGTHHDSIVMYDKIQAMRKLLGDFKVEGGIVNKAMRQLSKKPNMLTMYGIGNEKLISNLILKTFISHDTESNNAIYSRLELAVAANNATDYNTLIALTKTLGLTEFSNKLSSYITKDGKINSKALSVTLTPKEVASLYKDINMTLGVALKQAIKEIFGEFKDTKDSINHAAGLMTAYYNVILKQRVKQVLKETKSTELTVEAYNNIIQELNPLFPAVQSPFATSNIELAAWDNLRDYSDNEKTKVTQVYTKGTLANLAAYIKKLPTLKNPGASPCVLTIQMLDGTVANRNLGEDYALLNVHDAAIMGFNDIQSVATIQNKNFIETMDQYSIMGSIKQSLEEKLALSKEYFAKMGLSTNKSNDLLDAEFKAMAFKPNFKDDPNKLLFINAASIRKKIIENVSLLAEETIDNKTEIVNGSLNVNQFYFPGYGYKKENTAPLSHVLGVATKDINSTIVEAVKNEANSIDTLAKLLLINKTKVVDKVSAAKPGQLLNEVGSKISIYWNIPGNTLPSVATITHISSDNRVITVKNDSSDKVYQFTFNSNNYANPIYLNSKHTSAKVTGLFVKDANALGSSVNSNISVDPNDYSIQQEINQQNVVDTYNQLKNLSNVPMDAQHDMYIQSMLTDVASTVMPSVDLFIKTDETVDTQGVFAPGSATIKNKIFLSHQTITSGTRNMGLKMSMGEAFAHEVIHPIIYTGLRLDAVLRSQVRELYNYVKAELHTNPNAFVYFLNDPTINLADSAYTFEIAEAKERYNYVFGDKIRVNSQVKQNQVTGKWAVRNDSTELDEFMAFALSNANFNRFVTGLKLDSSSHPVFSRNTWKGVIGKNIQETLLNIYSKITELIQSNYKHATTDNVAHELRRLAKELARVDSENKSTIYSFIKKKEFLETKLATAINSKLKNTIASWNISKGAKFLADMYKNEYRKDTHLGLYLREVAYKWHNSDYGVAASILTSLRGPNRLLANLHTALNNRKYLLDGARNLEIEKFSNAVADYFGRKLTKPEDIACTHVLLKADLAALASALSVNEIADIVQSKTKLDRAISAIVGEIKNNPALSKHLNYYIKNAESLSHLIVHGKALNKTTLSYIRPIATMRNTKFKGTLTEVQINQAESILDRLTSLYTLQRTAEIHKTTVAALFTENTEGMAKLLETHKQLKEEALLRLFNGNKNKFQKGYIHQIFNTGIRHETGLAEEEAAFKFRGFDKSSLPIAKDPAHLNEPDQYLYVNRNGRANSLVSALISYTGNTAKGSKAFTNPIKMSELVHQRKAAFDDYSSNKALGPNDNYLIPSVNDDGDVVSYRYQMAQTTKDNVLEQTHDMTAVIGAMAGEIIDKIQTNIHNEKAIQAVKDIYNTDYKLNPGMYVLISDNAPEQRYRDIYAMIPDQARKDMKRIWGAKHMYVRKDCVDLLFGYYQYSMTNAFDKTAQDRTFFEKALVNTFYFIFKDKAVAQVKNFEDMLIWLTKTAKNTVIVKGIEVTLGNAISNQVYLKMRGVPNSFIFTHSKAAIIDGEKYQRDKRELDNLVLKLKVVTGSVVTGQIPTATNQVTITNLKSRIRELETDITNNPTTVFIESGGMPGLVDDLNIDSKKTLYPGLIDTAINKQVKKLPSTLQTVGNVLLMTEDTQGYKLANNMVKMTDFVARYILYKWYTDPARGSEQKSKKEAVTTVMDEFINFNIPNNRKIDYLNQIGLLWYTKYAIGILPVVAKAIKDKPFEALSTFALANTFGIPSVVKSVPTNLRGLTKVIGNPFTEFGQSFDEGFVTSLISGAL